MASRFNYDSGDWEEANYYLWAANVRRAIEGRRGQLALRELEAALLALPEKRLISGALCHEGQVCALGALGVYKRMQQGATREEALAWVWEHTPHYSDGEIMEYTAVDTADFGKAHLGLTYVLAWHIAQENDEHDAFTGPQTPEQRYEWMLRWVRRELGVAL